MKFVFLFLFAGCICLKYSDADCNVIPMTQWAGEASHRKDHLSNPIDLVVIQHTATPQSNEDEDCETALRNVRTYHMTKLQFTDIGQSFFICGSGKVYEGSGWNLVGAHTKQYNSKSIAISFIGYFESQLPTPAALNSALDLIACGVSNNHLTSDYQVVGHKQLSVTMSPGEALQSEIQNWPHWVNGTGRH